MIVFSEDKNFALNNNNVLYYATSRPTASGMCDLVAYIGAGESVQLARGTKEELQAIIKDIAIADKNGQEAYTVAVSDMKGAESEEALKNDTRYTLPVNGGELIIDPARDADYPGVYVSFRPQGQSYDYTLALLESPYDDGDATDPERNSVRFHLWENPKTDDSTYASHVKLSAYDSEEAVC